MRFKHASARIVLLESLVHGVDHLGWGITIDINDQFYAKNVPLFSLISVTFDKWKRKVQLLSP
jgi:hypothetical protein